MWPHDMETGRSVAVVKSEDPGAWYAYADSNVPIVTQWDDGDHDGVSPGTVFTSSSSMPSLVFSMPSDLDVRPAQRVLEIGAGTGWNAALLAHRVGAENVVTVELDATVALSARAALERVGLPVRVVHGDGFLWIPARVAAAVQTEHGHAALGTFYDTLWTDPDGTEREWIGDLAEALRRCGLPAELADAGSSDAYDAALRASHHDGVDRIDAEIGTPVLALTSPDGGRRAMFGPVLSALPTPAEAIRLWEATRLLGGVTGFREIKR